jgi:hypothetical protein
MTQVRRSAATAWSPEGTGDEKGDYSLNLIGIDIFRMYRVLRCTEGRHYDPGRSVSQQKLVVFRGRVIIPLGIAVSHSPRTGPVDIGPGAALRNLGANSTVLRIPFRANRT